MARNQADWIISVFRGRRPKRAKSYGSALHAISWSEWRRTTSAAECRARSPRPFVLHAISSPALDPRFVACNTPSQAETCRPFSIARNNCNAIIRGFVPSQKRIDHLGDKIVGIQSAFLPYVSAHLGLPTRLQQATRPACHPHTRRAERRLHMFRRATGASHHRTSCTMTDKRRSKVTFLPVGS